MPTNTYSFESYLADREAINYYEDDEFLQKVVRHYTKNHFDTVDKAARDMSKWVSSLWRKLSDYIGYPENRPTIEHFNGFNQRNDSVVRPFEGVFMEGAVFSQALFSEKIHPWVKFVKQFLIYQNSESCIACPLTCTEGLAALLDVYADTPELKEIRNHIKEGINGEYAIGAQYISEIQGGSDIPSNLLEARFKNNEWRLYGDKFFCSAVHADYAAVTARPEGSDKIALFVVPSWSIGIRGGKRNNYTINRLKYKMGTIELPTAEITYDGAIAYPVGPLDRGVANVVGIVLTYSRLTVGLSAAAAMTRVFRDIDLYCRHRDAFGMKLNQFPMVKAQLNKIEKYARRTLCGVFKIYRTFLDPNIRLTAGMPKTKDKTLRQKEFLLRELILFQKIVTAMDSPDIIRLGMSLFGGHGVMEDFSSLPRLFRDAAVNELWEGPRNVLLTQIHRDLNRVMDWYPPDDFIAHMLDGADSQVISHYQKEMKKFMAHQNFFEMTPEIISLCEDWDEFCQKLFHEYQNIAMQDVFN
jgi:alkylation response protein AidB-like acyl-CoA dehydrogenase